MYNAYATSVPGAAPTMYMQAPAAMVPGRGPSSGCSAAS